MGLIHSISTMTILGESRRFRIAIDGEFGANKTHVDVIMLLVNKVNIIAAGYLK